MTVPTTLASARSRRLLPLAFVTYSFAYVDRSNYSLGAAGGLEHSLHISSGESGLLGGLLFVGWPLLLVATAAFYASYAVGRGDFGLSFALLIIAGGAMYAPYGPYFAFIPELLPADVAGPAMGAINAFGALGGFAGAYLVGVLRGGTSAGSAVIFLAASLFAAALLRFFVKRPSAAMSETKEVESLAIDPVSRRIPARIGGVAVTRSALHSGRVKTH